MNARESGPAIGPPWAKSATAPMFGLISTIEIEVPAPAVPAKVLKSLTSTSPLTKEPAVTGVMATP